MDSTSKVPEILAWWVAFGGSHMVLSSVSLRPRLVAAMGERAFLGVYSLVAAGLIYGLVASYWGNAHGGPELWSLGRYAAVKGIAMVLAIASIALLAASFAQPSPAGMDPRAETGPQGLIRVTRHPLFAAFAIWGLAHCLVNGFANDVAFFGGFAVFSYIGARHQDSRKRIERGAELDELFSQTSFLPFAAIVAGRGRFVPDELPEAALVAGAGLGVVVYLLHPMLFG